MKSIRPFVAAGALAALASAALARAGDDAALKKVPALDALVASLAKAESLAGDLDASVHMPNSADDHAFVRLTLKRPLFARYEVRRGKSDASSSTFVADGKQMWFSDSDSKKCWPSAIDEKAKPTCPVSTPGFDLLVRAFYDAPAILAGKADAPWKAALATAQTSEATLDGEPCDVVRLESPNGVTILSISKKTGLPRRIADDIDEGGAKLSVTWDVAKIDASTKLEDSAFAFVVPDGYQKTDAPPPPDADLLAVGTDAPDVAGDSPTAGKRLKLSDYRGKVVLLNFWFEH
jgi:outer membrane lipoprotein-sorting protein